MDDCVTHVFGPFCYLCPRFIPPNPPPAVTLSFPGDVSRAGGGDQFWTMYQGLRSRWSLTPGYSHFGPPGLLFSIAALKMT